MKLNWKFLWEQGVQNKKPSVGGIWIFSGTAQADIETNEWTKHSNNIIYL